MQSGSITSYDWTITGAANLNLSGQAVSFPMLTSGACRVDLTVTSSGTPALTDTFTYFLYLSPDCNFGC